MKRIAPGILLLAIGGLLGGALWWRGAARRRSLPCPTWLAWSLENPFTELVIGSRPILDGLALAPGMRVVDAGCGPGRLTIPAAERVGPTGEVVALDIQPGMLARLDERIAARGLGNVRPVQGGLGEGRLPEGAFDRALLVTVLGEVPDRAAALRELHQALRPGGILAVGEVLLDPHYQPPATVRRLAEEAGFRVGRLESRWPSYTLHLIKPAETENGAAPAP